MSGKLEFDVDWEVSDHGSPEERACFAAIGIVCNDKRLTEGTDAFVNRIRTSPFLSAYHLAEWFAWNWWRLRWEPRAVSPSSDWALAHRMATVGHGYVWPNITVFSDGERTALIAKPTLDRNQGAFRYISDQAAVIASTQFENAIDEFVEQVRGQLTAERLIDTNLQRIWSELSEERDSKELSQRRRLEALMGYDPDEADPMLLDRLVVHGRNFGAEAANEIAADTRKARELTAEQLAEVASYGFDFSPRDAVRLRSDSIPTRQDAAAWRRGAYAARALREQEALGSSPLTNLRLSQMAGVQEEILTERARVADVSFALDDNAARGKIVLRSKWIPGRRFELARIIGDRIMANSSGKLFPATASYTYRQKAQRSFAAELLSPFDAIDNLLAGDYSTEAQQDIAEEFKVSELTIRTSLMNHGRIEREGMDEPRLGEEF